MNAMKLVSLCILTVALGCSTVVEPQETAEERETLDRTEFTNRIENFFEYEALETGRSSQFLIHLTDLTDGTPVQGAHVSLTVRPSGGDQSIQQTTAQVGKVTGIYVAELAIAQAGTYDIEFQVQNDKLNERMLLSGFDVE